MTRMVLPLAIALAALAGFTPPLAADVLLIEEVRTAEGMQLPTNGLTQDEVRARFGDPLVHYALNCASVGCPDLQTQAWSASTLQKQFDDGARAYVNHPRGLTVEERHLRASKIYRWYADDFGGTSGLKDHWQAFADPQLAARLARFARPQSYFYDWSLNDAG